jgi:hypothetical protein
MENRDTYIVVHTLLEAELKAGVVRFTQIMRR